LLRIGRRTIVIVGGSIMIRHRGVVRRAMVIVTIHMMVVGSVVGIAASYGKKKGRTGKGGDGVLEYVFHVFQISGIGSLLE
jgi:hypothetical protein